MTTRHTGAEYSTAPLLADGGAIGFQIGPRSFSMASVPGIDGPQERANAKRLADCWNACLGISSEHLSQGVVPLHQHSSAVHERDELAAKVRYYEQALCRQDAPRVAVADGISHVDVAAPSIELVADVLRHRDELLGIVRRLIGYNRHYSVATRAEWDRMILDATAADRCQS